MAEPPTHHLARNLFAQRVLIAGWGRVHAGARYAPNTTSANGRDQCIVSGFA